MDVAVFELNNTRHAVDLSAVQQVIPISPITPVPAAPPALLGAMNVGGKVLPVVDLALLLVGQAITEPLAGDDGLLLRAGGFEAVGVVGRILDVCSTPGAEVAQGQLQVGDQQLLLVDAGELLGNVAAQVSRLAARSRVSLHASDREQPRPRSDR